MRRRGRQAAEGTGLHADSDALAPLLGDDELGAAGEALSGRGSGAGGSQADPQQQLIVFQQFNLPTFLSYIYRCWQSVFGAVVSLVAAYLPSSASSSGPHQEPEEALSLLQVQRLESLRERIAVHYDPQAPEHQALLRQLWALTFPDIPCTALKSPQWKEMGWQGDDPGTDFRGAGLFGLQNLIHFAEASPTAYRRLVDKADGTRAEWEYPFAAGGLNLTVMLSDLLHLRDTARGAPGPAARTFRRLLAVSPTAFEDLYCAAYEVLDTQWLRMKADYMQFNAVLKETRRRVEVVLAGRPQTMEDMLLRLADRTL